MLSLQPGLYLCDNDGDLHPLSAAHVEVIFKVPQKAAIAEGYCDPDKVCHNPAEATHANAPLPRKATCDERFTGAPLRGNPFVAGVLTKLALELGEEAIPVLADLLKNLIRELATGARRNACTGA